MTRRSLFLLPFLPVALLTPEDSPEPKDEPLGHAFVQSWNDWVASVVEAESQGSRSVRELRLWKQVKSEWSKLRPKVDQWYG
jgi:hypothetical protein